MKNNLFDMDEPESVPAVPVYVRLRNALLQHLGTQGKRLKDFDALSLHKALIRYQRSMFPAIGDGDLGYCQHLIWVQRLYETTGRRYDADRPAFPQGYNFEADYQQDGDLLLPPEVNSQRKQGNDLPGTFMIV